MAIVPLGGCSDCSQEPSLTAQAQGATHVRQTQAALASPSPAAAEPTRAVTAPPRANPPHLGKLVDVSA